VFRRYQHAIDSPLYLEPNEYYLSNTAPPMGQIGWQTTKSWDILSQNLVFTI